MGQKDGFVVYPLVLPKSIHGVSVLGTVRVERYHSTLRIHLNRLSRRSICFSRSAIVLKKCAEIYVNAGA